MTPYVGPPTPAYHSSCGFSHAPGDSRCPNPAVSHIMTFAPEYGPVGLASCSSHTHIAKAAGSFIAQHPFQPVCADPRAQWIGMADPDGGHCEIEVPDPTPASAAMAEALT